MAKIDAHQHFWNLSVAEYDWLTPEYRAIYKNFEPADLQPQLNAAEIDKTVLIQSANSYEDTAYLLCTADQHDWIGAVIGWVDLIAPKEVEKRVKMYKQHPKFRGVRHLINAEANLDWLVDPVVQDSLQVLADNDLIFEVAAVFPNHLKHVPTLAEKMPNLKLVIDHLATPKIKERVMSPWSEQLQAAAMHPNVYAKVSGLNLAADWETWTHADIKPYIDFAREVFGAKRLMFGSNWPVCNLAGSYQAVWEATRRALDDYSQGDIDAILGKTAQQVYRI